MSIGFIIGVFIIGPYFIRNYIELGNLIVKNATFQNNSNKSISDFIITYQYFNGIVKHIILLIGHNPLITTDKIVYLCVMLILFLFVMYNNKNILLQKSNIAILLIGLLGCAIIEANIYVSYIITVFILLLFLYITDIIKNKNVEIGIPISLSILIEFIVFFYTHYIIFLTRGKLGAMHGRYFYPIIFPALYIIGYGIIRAKEENVKYLPLMILPILIYIEIHTIGMTSVWWN